MSPSLRRSRWKAEWAQTPAKQSACSSSRTDSSLRGRRSAGPGADLGVDAQHVLDVVAQLVGQHVGLGEVAGRPEAVGQLPEEGEVDVGLRVDRAVEGPGGRGGGAAAGLHAVPEQDQLGVRVVLACVVEVAAPEPLDVVEDERHEVHGVGVGVVGRVERILPCRGPARRRELAEDVIDVLDVEAAGGRIAAAPVGQAAPSPSRNTANRTTIPMTPPPLPPPGMRPPKPPSPPAELPRRSSMLSLRP